MEINLKFLLKYNYLYLKSLVQFCKSILIIKFHNSYHGTKISKYCYLANGCSFSYTSNLIIEDFVDIQRKCTFTGDIWIKRFTRIGEGTRILSNLHDYNQSDAIPFGTNSKDKGIIIEENVWIGQGVIILSGVTINKGSIISAGSVVTQNIPEYSIVTGNPGKPFLKRNTMHYDRLESENKFYSLFSFRPIPSFLSFLSIYNNIIGHLNKSNFMLIEVPKINDRKNKKVLYVCRTLSSNLKGKYAFGNFGLKYIIVRKESLSGLHNDNSLNETQINDLVNLSNQ